MYKGKKILFYNSGLYTFVKEDLEILSDRYTVVRHDFVPSKNGFKLLISLFNSLIFTLRYIRSADVIYSFFPGYHVFFGALAGNIFKKKVVIILGGYESVYIPSINYGAVSGSRIYSRVVRQCIRWSDVLLAVDESLFNGVNKYADPSGRGYIIGVENFVKPLTSQRMVVPTGYDADKWFLDEKIIKNKAIVTIGNAHDYLTFKRKGFDFLIDIAKEMLDVDFYFIGLGQNYIQYYGSDATPNCHFLGFIENNLLAKELNKYKVFAQLSLSEGLPNSLCEAMLCGCIPVGSNVNGIPKAIGGTGYIISTNNLAMAIDVFRQALSSENKRPEDARNRIINLFAKSYRREKLYDVIDKL